MKAHSLRDVGVMRVRQTPDFDQAMHSLAAVARRHHSITCDDVRDHMARHSVGPVTHCNAIGAAFRAGQADGLIFATPHFRSSQRREARGRAVRVWRSRVCKGGVR